MSGRRKQDWTTRFSRETFRRDLGETMADAMEAFWGVIHKEFQTTHGDLDPATVIDQAQHNMIAVLKWLVANGNDLVSNEALVFLRDLHTE